MMSRRIFFLLSLPLCSILIGCGDFARKNVCLNALDASCQEDEVLSGHDIPDLNGPNPNFPDCNALATNPSADSCVLRAKKGRAEASVRLSEVLLDPIGDNAGAQKIEIWNFGKSDFDLSNYVLVSGEMRWTIDAGRMVYAGETLVVHVGTSGSDDSHNTFAPGFGPMESFSGELALVRADGAIVSYIQWGSAGHALEGYAAGEGQWISGEATSTPLEGSSLQFVGGDGAVGASAFAVLTPTVGK